MIWSPLTFLVTSFKLANAPVALMDLMNDVFNDYLGRIVIVLIDDLLIYSKKNEHDEHF